LSGLGSIRTGGRFNPKGAFEILYFANHADTMLREVRIVQYDVGGNAISVPSRPYIAISLQYEFALTIDLNDPAIQAALKIDHQDLTSAWELDLLNGTTPVTQDLGIAARDTGIEALIVPSARHAGFSNVAVIRDQLLESSFIRIHRPEGFPPGTETEIRGFKKARN